MGINSTSDQRGHVLLIAGDRAVHRRRTQLRPSTNLSALAVVPTPVLLGSTAPADLVHLDGIDNQNALLLRLRAAAATPGPLLVYLSGRLTTDRRADQLHLALTSTTTLNARYTALPWSWLRAELRERPPGTSTVLVDLAADKRAWTQLQSPEGRNLLTAGLDLYGVVSPPGYTAGTDTGSDYTRTLIEQLRQHPERPSTAHLHALTIAGTPLPPGTLVLPAAPEIAPAPQARPPMTNVQRLLADLNAMPGRRRADEPGEPAPGLAHLPPVPAEYAPAPQPVRTDPSAPTAPPAPVTAPVAQQDRPAAAARPAQRPMVGVPGQDARGRWVLPGHDRTAATEQPVRAPHPGTTAPASALVQQPAVAQPPAEPPQQDPRPHIHALATAGKHQEAAQLAQMWEQQALHQYGPASPQATQWCEIRADLARMAGNLLLATQLWIAAARTRLAYQAPDAPEALAAATRAHYCWTHIEDPARARECGPDLVDLLRHLPTLDQRHLSMAAQRLEYLNNAQSRP